MEKSEPGLRLKRSGEAAEPKPDTLTGRQVSGDLKGAGSRAEGDVRNSRA